LAAPAGGATGAALAAVVGKRIPLMLYRSRTGGPVGSGISLKDIFAAAFISIL
jgi:hypothetical protein